MTVTSQYTPLIVSVFLMIFIPNEFTNLHVVKYIRTVVHHQKDGRKTTYNHKKKFLISYL